ncbi:MAG: modified peptide precursor CbpA [Candidatus Hydrogenedentota bacterium]
MKTSGKRSGTGAKKAVKSGKVIAFRRTCEAKGTGLSHYILMKPKSK